MSKSKNDVLELALEIALDAHKGQVDKMGKPYILHPLAVASKLDDLDLKIIGLLHDVLEDSELTADVLVARGIPKEIVEVVEVLTRKEGEPYDDYIQRVKENPKATKVKLADLAHNTDEKRADGLNEARKKKYELAKEMLKG